jgi:hypothetical protein
VGSKTSLDVVVKRKIVPCQESNPGRPVHSLLIILTELCLGGKKQQQQTDTCPQVIFISCMDTKNTIQKQNYILIDLHTREML